MFAAPAGSHLVRLRLRARERFYIMKITLFFIFRDDDGLSAAHRKAKHIVWRVDFSWAVTLAPGSDCSVLPVACNPLFGMARTLSLSASPLHTFYCEPTGDCGASFQISVWRLFSAALKKYLSTPNATPRGLRRVTLPVFVERIAIHRARTSPGPRSVDAFARIAVSSSNFRLHESSRRARPHKRTVVREDNDGSRSNRALVFFGNSKRMWEYVRDLKQARTYLPASTRCGSTRRSRISLARDCVSA